MNRFESGLRKAGLAIAVAASLLAAPAWAGTPEHDRLADTFAAAMFELIDFKAMATKSIEGEDLMMLDKARPGWSKLFAEAMSEEFEHDSDKLVHVFGVAFGKAFTDAELKVGIESFKDPAIREIFKAGAEGREADKNLQPTSKTMKLISSPAGKSFFEKLSSLEKVMGDVESDLVAEILPGAFRRFADKADAAEAARRPAAGN